MVAVEGAMSTVLESLRLVFGVPSSGIAGTYGRLRDLVDTTEDSPELLGLCPEDMRAVHGFRIGLHKFQGMEPDMLRQHVLAQWRGAKVAILRMSIGHQANELIKEIDRYGGRL